MNKIFLLIFSVMLYSSCSLAGIENQNNSFDLADSAVKSIFDSYQQYSSQGFHPLVSENFQPNMLGFVNEIAAQASRESNINFDYSLDQVLTKDDKLAVSLKWHKKRFNIQTKQNEKLSGKAELIFQNESDSWKLFKINGDNPFTN